MCALLLPTNVGAFHVLLPTAMPRTFSRPALAFLNPCTLNKPPEQSMSRALLQPCVPPSGSNASRAGFSVGAAQCGRELDGGAHLPAVVPANCHARWGNSIACQLPAAQERGAELHAQPLAGSLACLLAFLWLGAGVLLGQADCGASNPASPANAECDCPSELSDW